MCVVGVLCGPATPHTPTLQVTILNYFFKLYLSPPQVETFTQFWPTGCLISIGHQFLTNKAIKFMSAHDIPVCSLFTGKALAKDRLQSEFSQN